MKLYTPSSYKVQADNFFSAYKIQKNYLCETSNRKTLANKHLRVCMFCGRSAKHTTFNSEAHLIPVLLGNKNLISDFECDKCNSFFKKYENDLTNFLGINRAIHKVNTRKGPATFLSADKKISAKSIGFKKTDGVSVKIEDGTSIPLEITEEGASFSFKYLKRPFVPLYVYKAFLKIALSAIGPEEKSSYRHAINYVRYGNTANLNPCLIRGYHLPHSYSFKPKLMLFKKKYKVLRTFTHVLVCHFQNSIYEIPVPFNDQDLFFYNQRINVIECPPLSLNTYNGSKFSLQPFHIDFSSANVVNDQEENLKVEIRREDLKDVIAVNPNTNEAINLKNFDKEIVEIIIKSVVVGV